MATLESGATQDAGRGDPWPALDYAAWRDTCTTFHLWTQMVGKTRLAYAPMLNHWWQVTLYVSPRGLTTSAIPHRSGDFEITFDLIDHRLRIETSDGTSRDLALAPCPIADFFADYCAALRALGIAPRLWPMPVEIPGATRFDDDHAPRSYDPDAATRFWRALVQADRVMQEFRSGFIGKASPVHFFWGSFDLAVTRFSGRTAPVHPGGAPNVGDWVMREAYSHEESSAGFWPGNDAYPRAAFYAYAYPEPAGVRDRRIGPAGAAYSSELGEFLLPYDAVRNAPDPDAALREFLEATYAAAADLAAWDRAALERAPGTPR